MIQNNFRRIRLCCSLAALAVLPTGLAAQGLVVDGATVLVQAGASVQVQGRVNHQNNGTVTNNGRIALHSHYAGSTPKSW